MLKLSRIRSIRSVLVLLTTASLALGLAFGVAVASGSGTSRTLPCNSGGSECMKIGFTDAWLNGHTVQLEYSHRFFCEDPPPAEANSECEAGRPAQVPPSGPVVSSIYELIPLGFTPPDTTLQCDARCIDHPRTMDLSHVFGDMGENAMLPARSFVIEEDESFQSTWWPVVLVGVKNLHAWNKIVAAKNVEAVDACQTAGGCAPEVETNAYVFFQVLGPGMSPGGPA
ncbi:MAG: hypothetical protein QOI60_1030 [Actinomycetota bacterium]|nr:hypothetical protein [Actinomycetota bacterium]